MHIYMCIKRYDAYSDMCAYVCMSICVLRRYKGKLHVCLCVEVCIFVHMCAISASTPSKIVGGAVL